MAKPDDTDKATWGTWEELLLACAVNRHGTKNWDSIAMEIQNRSSSLHLLTAQNCKQKYHELKRRFMAMDDRIDDGEDESETDDKMVRNRWLDELRKLRVAELRREVQRYDVSIVSLQLKVKRLKEERDRSLNEKENIKEKPDLEDLEEERAKDNNKEGDGEPERSSQKNVAGKLVSDEESDRENQSYHESNSTNTKGDNRENGLEEAKIKPEPVETAAGEANPVSDDLKPGGDGSYNGSSYTIAKESAAERTGTLSKSIPTKDGGDSPELYESVAESKGAEKAGTKENSDVQSSASLSRRKRCKKAISGRSSGEKPESCGITPANKRSPVESEPLARFLENIRSHKHGNLFERPPESQETTKYKSLIRQHVDLETVRTRLDQGRYSACPRKFFRDLLLLFNNAIVFFPKNSSEFISANEFRVLVSREMAITIQNSNLSPHEPTPPPPISPPLKPELLLVKPRSSAPMIVCRKRSSISAKASSAGIEKAAPHQKKPDDFSANMVGERGIKKERTMVGSASGTRGSRTNTKTNKNSNTNSYQNPSPGWARKGGTPGNNNSEPKLEKIKRKSDVAKKGSVANFLKRMKRNSSSNGTLIEALKGSVKNSKKGEAEKKKSGRGKGESGKDEVSRHSSLEKQAQEQSSSAKRSVGRPPKKAMVPPPLPRPTPSKRRRETIETEVVATGKPRKRASR